MIFWENVCLAFVSLLANKMRALLTMLGIIIGISSVIAIMTVGESLSSSISANMESMGGNNITVMLNFKEQEEERTKEGAVLGQETNNGYVVNDSDYITREMIAGLYEQHPDEIKAISVTESLCDGKVVLGKEYARVEVTGVNVGFFSAQETKMIAGNVFSVSDLEDGSHVALVSNYLVDNLFEGDCNKALGQEISVDATEGIYTFTIIGVYEYDTSKLMSMGMSSKYDTRTSVYIPFKAAVENKSFSGFTSFDLVTKEGVDSSKFCNVITHYFDGYYRNNRKFCVTTYNMASIVSVFTDMLGTITTAISVIAGIALIVGGIGVMNIMLVSITERTREIGTRKALGATNSSIRLQFITEAIVICLVGGIIGIILGIALGMGAANLLNYPAKPSVYSIFLSLGFSMAIGIFFGYYPANKAAKMDPIEALRYE